MPKRKAKEIDNGVVAEEPRRSSRRISTVKEEVSPTSNKPAPKKSKKGQKIPQQQQEEPIVNGKDDQESESVSTHRCSLGFILAPLPTYE